MTEPEELTTPQEQFVLQLLGEMYVHKAILEFLVSFIRDNEGFKPKSNNALQIKLDELSYVIDHSARLFSPADRDGKIFRDGVKEALSGILVHPRFKS